MTEPSDRVCPRCGAVHAADQEYCVECGLRLPPTTGGLARLRDAWIRRIGWYPGDWVWTTILAFVVAAAGAAAAIALTANGATSSDATTIAATLPTVPLTTPTVPSTTTRTTTPEAGRPIAWPAGQSGWTVVLESLPETAGGRVQANARAGQAAKAGLPEVGVLVSSRYASLHPGYVVVFAGVYDTRAQAESTLNAAYAAGFASAYVRQIAQ